MIEPDENKHVLMKTIIVIYVIFSSNFDDKTDFSKILKYFLI